MKKAVLIMLVLLSYPLLAEVYLLRLEGVIDTISEEYVANTMRWIEKQNDAKLVVLELDTPGGLDTSMRAIIKEMLGCRAPVAVLVAPRGSRAASAGFFIAMAADIAAMAPGTNMGAAHPVALSGGKLDRTMKDKVTNDAASYIITLAKNHGRNPDLAEKAVRQSLSYTAEECQEKQLIDFLATDVNDLVAKLEGRVIKRSGGEEFTLALKREKIQVVDMSARQKFLKTITNPNLAYFLLIFGLIGLYIEFTHPGVAIPGILGGISLLLAFLAFQVLPINYVGLGLILLAVGFFIAEIKVQGFGLLGVGGIVSFILGSVILMDSPIPEMRPAMSIIFTVAICFGFIFLFLTYKVVRAMRRRPESGREGMIGESGTAQTDIGPAGGRVFVHGEWWQAVSSEPIAAGTTVHIEAVNNLVLSVKKRGGK